MSQPLQTLWGYPVAFYLRDDHGRRLDCSDALRITQEAEVLVDKDAVMETLRDAEREPRRWTV